MFAIVAVEARHFERNGDLRAELQRLIEGPTGERHAGDAARKTEIILDARRRARLPAKGALIEHERRQPLGRGIDRCSQPRRSRAHNRYVIDAFRIQLGGHAKADAGFDVGGASENRPVRAYHQGQLVRKSLEVPRSYDLLMDDLRGFVPFAICFAILAMIWRVHYIFSRRYGLEDRYTVFLNMVLLLVVLFYIYPLKFIFSFTFSFFTGSGESGDISFQHALVLVQLFTLGFAGVFLLFALLYAHASRLSAKLGLNAVERQTTLDMTQLYAAYCAVGVLSFGVAFKNPFWAGFLLNLIVPINIILNAVSKKRIRRLLAAGA